MTNGNKAVYLCCTILTSAAGMAPQPAMADAPAVVLPTDTATSHKPDGAGVETVEVRAAEMHTANGVTNTTPGGGLMPVQTVPRSQSAVTRDFIAKQAPTSNAMALTANLPGVIVATNDALGLTDGTMTIRGMVEQQIGYLFEGAPATDPISYTPYTNALVDTENLARVTVSQGSPDISSPLFNAVGGQFSMSEMDPDRHAGGFAEVSAGLDDAYKEFMRIETGEIGHSDIYAFASFSNTSSDNWRGPGDTKRKHVDAKLSKEWGLNNSVKLVFAYNKTQYNSYLNPTLAQWKEYGTDYNLDPTYTFGDTKYYQLNQKNNNAYILVAPVRLGLAPGLNLGVTPYFNRFSGPGISASTLSENSSYLGTTKAGALDQPYSSNGTITALSDDPYTETTGGFTSSVDWKRGNNELSFGYWYSYATHDEHQSYSTVDYSGNVANAYGEYPIRTADGQILSAYNINFTQQTNTLFVADTLSLFGDRLTVTGGFKAAMVDRWSTNLIPGATYNDNRNYFEPLPQVYLSYKLTDRDQIYVNGTTSFRAPASVQAYVQIFSAATGKASSQPSSLKPEYAIGEEIGYRHTGLVNVSLALFNYNITNHQVSSSGYLSGTTTLISEQLDVGGETSRGAQAEIGLRPWHHISPYLSAQYLHVTIDNNFHDGTDYLPTTGKIAPESPKFSGAIGLNYDDGHVFGNIDLRYVDSQYSTFMDDESIPAYMVSDATVGYRFKSFWRLNHPQVQLNLTNIGNNHYLSGYAGVTGNAKATKGVYGTTIAASSPTYYVGGGFGFLATVSTGF